MKNKGDDPRSDLPADASSEKRHEVRVPAELIELLAHALAKRWLELQELAASPSSDVRSVE